MDRLTIRPRSAAGAGARWLLGTLLAQALVAGAAVGRPAPPVPVDTVVLSGATVAQEPFGDAGSLAERRQWPPGTRVQLSLASDDPLTVLWFSGDGVEQLHPRPGAAGPVDGVLAVPGPGAWLRLTATPTDGDLVVAIAGQAPTAPLTHPQPAAVASLRRSLERAAAVHDHARGVSRFLPTADGRAVPVPWERAEGAGRAVLAWRVSTPTATASSGTPRPR